MHLTVIHQNFQLIKQNIKFSETVRKHRFFILILKIEVLKKMEKVLTITDHLVLSISTTKASVFFFISCGLHETHKLTIEAVQSIQHRRRIGRNR